MSSCYWSAFVGWKSFLIVLSLTNIILLYSRNFSSWILFSLENFQTLTLLAKIVALREKCTLIFFKLTFLGLKFLLYLKELGQLNKSAQEIIVSVIWAQLTKKWSKNNSSKNCSRKMDCSRKVDPKMFAKSGAPYR